MLRWLLLLTTLARSSLWWCSGEAIDSMPEFTTDEERQMLELEQQMAEVETRAKAKTQGKGPLVTEKLVEAAKIKVRDEAHDRVHLRLVQEADGAGAEEAELIPVQAMMPAGVVRKMMEKEKNSG